MKFHKALFIAPIRGYQYISRMLPANCRYYPTCSEYAKWQFEFNAPHRALTASTLRILRCNQLFAGGIDYPLTTKQPPSCPLAPPTLRPHTITFWLVPHTTKEGYYYIIKAF